jgi:hypothetical protein
MFFLIFTACQPNVPEKQVTSTSPNQVATATSEPSSTPTKSPPKQTDTPWPKPLNYTPTPLYGNQSWRLELIPTGNKIADDQYTNSGWDDLINGHARNLAIASPFFWEFSELPDQTRYAEIEDYYIKAAQKHGYKLGNSVQGVTRDGQNTYLLTFVKGSGTNASRIVLEFWAKTPDYPATLMILYSNP